MRDNYSKKRSESELFDSTMLTLMTGAEIDPNEPDQGVRSKGGA